MKKKLLARWDIPFYILVAVFWFWLAAQIPYTHDDWDWGLDIGLKQLFTANLNARYSGNFFEVIMTRSEFLRILIVGSGFTLLPLSMAATAWGHCRRKGPAVRLIFFTVANVLILSMPRGMWQLTYGWTAGYANFCLSTLIMIYLVGKVLAMFREDRQRLSLASVGYFDLFALAFFGQLFLENISIYMTALLLVAVVIAWIREKKLPVGYLLMAVGALLGLYVVFQSDIYQELWDTGTAVSGYRKMWLNSLVDRRETILSCLKQAKYLIPRALEENLTLVLAASATLSLAVLAKKWGKLWVRILFVTGNTIFFLYHLLNRYLEFVEGIGWLAAINFVYFLWITVEILVLCRGAKLRLLLTWLSVAAVLAPLVVTSESGIRMCFPSSTLLGLFCLQLLGLWLEETSKKTVVAVTLSVSLVALLVLGAYFSKIYHEIGEAKRARVEYINQEVEAGSGVILIPRYPHTEFIWRPNPINDLRVWYFKEFYGIPQSTGLYF